MVRGKGNKARTLPISSEAYDAISEYISDRTKGSLFLTLDGKRTISTRAIQARFKKLAIEAGIHLKNNTHMYSGMRLLVGCCLILKQSEVSIL